MTAARAGSPATMSPEKQLAGFIAKFTPEVATLIRAARKKMRERLPQALEMVYDNYNFFVIGYGPTSRPSDARSSTCRGPPGRSSGAIAW